jgi:tRNA A-37 threonylcarbamoyl transferase component Bud32
MSAIDLLDSSSAVLELHRAADALCARFEKAWRGGESPRLAAWLPECGPLRHIALGELAHLDLEYRLQAGQSARVEDYFHSHPELRADRSVAVRLVITEARTRAWREPSLRWADYRLRFPELADRLGGDVTLLAPLSACPAPAPASTLPCGKLAQQLAAGLGLHVKAEIARGGMGVVLRARDNALDADVAVKVLLEKYQHKPELVRRFLEEAHITAQLHHRGIVLVHHAGQLDDGRPYFTMQLVQGQTLGWLLDDCADAAEDQPDLLRVFAQVCDTLAHAHALGVVHRDLKPSNVMLDPAGKTFVMDWGLAKVLPGSPVVLPNRDQTGELFAGLEPENASETGGWADAGTQLGTILGTPAYMPPEQARGEVETVDKRCDVFGLGAILCDILTGQPPFVGGDALRMARKAARADLADAFGRLDACSAKADLVAVAKRCLAPDPADRPRDAAALVPELAACL